MPCEYQIPKLVLLQCRLHTSTRSSQMPLFGHIFNPAPNSMALNELI